MQCPTATKASQEALERLPELLRPFAACNDLLGISMPSITFGLALLLVVLGLGLFFFYFLRPWWQLRAELRAADEFIDTKVPEKGFTIEEEAYNEIDEYFSKQPNLSYAWGEFSETIIKVENRFHNTVQAENFFNHASVIRKQIGTWHSAVPGILTGLGLFGTFVALLLGLAQLYVDPATEKVTGISEFINALSGKFSSSIAGLLMAILYTSCERILVSKLDNHLYHLQHSVNEIFTRMTPEKLLSLSLNESKKQSASMELLASDLAERLKTSMQQSVNPEINKMIGAIEKLNKTTENLSELNTKSLNRAIDALDGIKSQNSDAIVQAMQSMMEEFRSTLTGTASNELGELSKSLASAATFLESMDIQNQQMEDRM